MTTIAEQALRTGQHPRINHPGRPDNRVNMSRTDRIAAGIGGGTLAFLGLVRPSPMRLLVGAIGGGLVYLSATGHSPFHKMLGINNARRGEARPYDYFEDGIHVEVSYTIAKPAEELFRFWRQFENLPRIMSHVERVEVRDSVHSHWVSKGPAGKQVEWDAQIINEEPDRLIAWHSLPGADVDNAGSVRFIPAPGDRGTEVHVELDYIPPAGTLGFIFAKLFGQEPRQQIKEDLRHLKQLMEAGEIPTVEGQPQGTCSGAK